MLPDRSIVIGQKLIENAKNGQFKARKPEACGQTVLPDMSILIGQKLMKNSNAIFLVIFKQCAVGQIDF